MIKIFRRLVLYCKPAVHFILGFFFEKKYLKGRYFDSSFEGVLWALRALWTRNILRLAPPLPFPASFKCHISVPENIIFNADDLNNFQSPGVYFQNFKAKIYIGRGVYIAPNVGLITANHAVDRLDQHVEGKDIVIRESCWIGMNSVILPGVELGPHTIIAAGSVVTKSYTNGFAILAGVPAKPIKKIDIK